MSSSLNPGQPDGLTDWRPIATRAVGAIANTAQNVATPFVTWLTYPYRAYFHPMLHGGHGDTYCTGCGASLAVTTPYECGGDGQCSF